MEFKTYKGIKPSVYTIKHNHHYSTGPKWTIFEGDVLEGYAAFDENCHYNFGLGQTGDQLDINKVTGFTICGPGNHYSSARLGARWNVATELMDLFMYTYNKGVRQNVPHFQDDEIYLCSVPLGEIFYFKIRKAKDERRVWFTIRRDGQKWKKSMPMQFCPDFDGITVTQWFYAGGNRPAQREMKLGIWWVSKGRPASSQLTLKKKAVEKVMTKTIKSRNFVMEKWKKVKRQWSGIQRPARWGVYIMYSVFAGMGIAQGDTAIPWFLWVFPLVVIAAMAFGPEDPIV